MSTQLRLLQSGFVGYITPELLQVPAREVSIQSEVTTKSIFKPDTTNFYDADIHVLVSRMENDTQVLSDFEFREVILKKAISVFSRNGTFREWFTMQVHSPALTYLHKRFLKETLDYAMGNTHRPMSGLTYRRLLYVGKDATQESVADITSGKKEDFSPLDRLGDVTTEALLSQWTQDVDGYQDLLVTLSVIFGRRSSPGV